MTQKKSTEWMQQQGFNSYNDVMQYYENFLWKLMKSLGKSMIAWQEIFDGYNLNLPTDIIIEVSDFSMNFRQGTYRVSLTPYKGLER
jgi:N-acetyl-beta-hexosaminidase